MLNMNSFQKETDIHITKVTMTIADRRSGKIEDLTFFRPAGKLIIPDKHIEDHLKEYGYDVIGYKDEDFVEGMINWENLFYGFKTLEGMTA